MVTNSKEQEIREAALRILELVRRRLSKEARPILVMSVCFELNNAAYLPPQIGVVFLEDAEEFRDSRNGYPDGSAALLNPTLQEDYDFPTHTTFPFVEIVADDIPIQWDAGHLFDNALRLVDELNRARVTGEPPFVLVDLEGDAADYVDRLGESDRQVMIRYGLT